MKIDADSVINALASTGEAMSTKRVSEFLGTKNTRQVCGLLTELVLAGEIKRAQNQGYQLPDAAPYDLPRDRKEVLPTQKAAAKTKKEKGLMPGGQKGRPDVIDPDWPKPHSVQIRVIETIEDAEEEAQVANLKEVEAAMNRLAVNVKQTPVLTEPDIKQDMLRRFAEIMEPSIANQCRELDDWLTAILSAEKK